MPSACLDASFVVTLLLPELASDAAWDLFREWQREGTELLAPPLMPFEVCSTLRLSVSTGRVTEDEGDTAFRAFKGLPILLRDPDNLLDHTWALGRLFKPRRLYDMSYVALAELTDCLLWTADVGLANLLGGRLPFLRVVS